jgi:hypothetical protein
MSRKTISSAGALHPILFFSLVYIVVFMLSIVVCSSVFYSCNTASAGTAGQEKQSPEKAAESDYTKAVAALK